MYKDLKIKVKSKFNFYPVTKENWKDFEKLFGEKGACAGCWCMYWRLRRKEYDSLRGAGTKKKMKNIVNKGIIPGIIAYDNDKPVGWCSVEPKSGKTADVFAWTGLASAFRKAGFKEIIRRSETRPIMRYSIK